jgi:hypothetical protein
LPDQRAEAWFYTAVLLGADGSVPVLVSQDFGVSPVERVSLSPRVSDGAGSLRYALRVAQAATRYAYQTSARQR